MLVQRQRLGTNLITPLHDGWREEGCSVTAAVLPGGGWFSPPDWLALVSSSYCAGDESP